MWIYLTLVSAVLLGAYDVCKKKALQRNSVMWVLFSTSAISTLILLPFFGSGTPFTVGEDPCDASESTIYGISILAPKAALVTLSWISGLIGMKLLPLTIASTLKASRPVFVIIFSMLIFGERLNPVQWIGVSVALAALWLLSRSSRKEGIIFHRNRGVLWMSVAIVSGVASALYDKHVVSGLHMYPMFVECWTNVLITILMGLVLGTKLLIRRFRCPDCADAASGNADERFRWDWRLLLTSVLIVGADTAYFFALADDGALLSLISLMRRGSVIVTFVLSAALFKETNLKDKALELALLLCGIAILALF